MGAISFSLDRTMVQELHRHLALEVFIETGTFRGDTLTSVRDLFTSFISIELSPEHHAAARIRFAGDPAIALLQGSSPDLLRAQHSKFTGRSALFWLDAHWCAAADTAGQKSQCPLLAELEAIGTLNENSALLIDDARLFLAPPPPPHDISDWPALDQILARLRQLSDRHALVCFNDVLVYLPAVVAPRMRAFFQAHTVDWLTLCDKARDYDLVLEQAQAKERLIHEIDRDRLAIKTSLEAECTKRDTLIRSLHDSAAWLQEQLKITVAATDTLREIADARAQEIAALREERDRLSTPPPNSSA